MSWWSDNVQNPLQKAKDDAGNLLHDVAPYVAVAVAIFAPELIPKLGYALGATTEAGAAAAGSAALTGGTTALAGGTPKQVASSAALAGVGGYAGSTGSKALGLSGTTGAAAGGAISGGTQAALTGKNIGEAALKGGATAGLSSSLQEGYKSLLPAENVDYSLNQPSGTGLKSTGSEGLKAPSTSTNSVDSSGTPDYAFTPSGNEASGIQTTDTSSDKNVFSPTTLSSTDREIANYIARYGVNKLSPAASPAASQTSNVAIGSQQSPAAGGAADVAMLDSTSPEGIGSKTGKKGGKYPWGDPEGTTALKQEGQGI
jgi:hypothetical protein